MEDSLSWSAENLSHSLEIVTKMLTHLVAIFTLGTRGFELCGENVLSEAQSLPRDFQVLLLSRIYPRIPLSIIYRATQVSNIVKELIQAIELPATASSLIVRTPKTSNIYFLPKIHKANNPGRPIVSACNCPTELISSYFDQQMAPFVQSLPSYIKDTNKGLSTSLATSRFLLPEYTPSKHCHFTKVSFSFSVDFYKQVNGVAMGTVSPSQVTSTSKSTVLPWGLRWDLRQPLRRLCRGTDL
ncbi:predicted protein [Nematostella vectensis]|uniref:Uncharacterized protein n=1 Tax=Nematostella vectensis TaxID=45351 RepID=A7SUH4_NEMVE|nr:predicted protein [Nematostella vectensis]|eukprot:XP_001624737.1 predicted protein [Nematostella vectensis]